MKTTWLLPGILVGLICCSSRGDTIATATFAEKVFIEPNFSGLTFHFAYWPSNVVFDPFLFNPEDIGRTVSVNESTDPDFQEVVHRLTNGLDEELWLMIYDQGAFHGTGKLESRFFSQRPDTAPDLIGFAIERMDLRLDSWGISEDPPWHDYQVTLSIIGQPVPEPGALALCLGGALLFLATRRWRGSLRQ